MSELSTYPSVTTLEGLEMNDIRTTPGERQPDAPELLGMPMPAAAPAPNGHHDEVRASSLPASKQKAIDMLSDVNLQLAVELGRTRLTVKQILDLQKGSVVELNRIAGDAVDVYVNDHLIARGEVVVVDDKFGVRITELITPNNDSGGG